MAEKKIPGVILKVDPGVPSDRYVRDRQPRDVTFLPRVLGTGKDKDLTLGGRTYDPKAERRRKYLDEMTG